MVIYYHLPLNFENFLLLYCIFATFRKFFWLEISYLLVIYWLVLRSNFLSTFCPKCLNSCDPKCFLLASKCRLDLTWLIILPRRLIFFYFRFHKCQNTFTLAFNNLKNNYITHHKNFNFHKNKPFGTYWIFNGEKYFILYHLFL